MLIFLLSLLTSSLLMKKAMDSDPEDGNSSESKSYHTSFEGMQGMIQRDPSLPPYQNQSAL